MQSSAHYVTRHMGRPISLKHGSLISIEHSCNSATRQQKRLKLKMLAAHSSYRASPPPPESSVDAFIGLHHQRNRPPCQEMRINLSSRGYRLPNGWVATRTMRRLQNVWGQHCLGSLFSGTWWQIIAGRRSSTAKLNNQHWNTMGECIHISHLLAP